MKTNILLLIIFLLYSNFIRSQEVTDVSFELNSSTPTSGNRTYTARDYSKLLTGFICNKKNTAESFKARLNEDLLFPVEYQSSSTISPDHTRTLDNSLPVGTLPGSYAVSPTGAATYSIPIDVPTGTNGMQPSVSVVYNSQSGMGILGWGWHLSAASAISRCGKTEYFDSENSPVTFTSEDRFSLDGMRLTLSNSSLNEYFVSGSKYNKEMYDFSTIDFISENSGFLITTKDGTQMWYGSTSDSKLKDCTNTYILSWNLSKVQDRFGNYMEYFYTNNTSEGECVLSEIKYTGNVAASLSTYNSIKFYYETRTSDDNTAYVSGTTFKSTKLLRKIETNYLETTLKSYSFNYIFDIHTKLYSIEETSKDGAKHNPTIVYFGNNSEDAQYEDDMLSESSGILNENSQNLIPMDFNGDGKRDIVAARCTTNSDGYPYCYELALYQKSGAPGGFTLSRVVSMPYTYTGISKLGGQIEIPNQFGLLVCDYNDDGCEDFTVYNIYYDAGVYKSNEIKLLYGNKTISSVFSNSKTYTLYPAKQISSSEKYLYPGDFDGDGNAEIYSFLDGPDVFAPAKNESYIYSGDIYVLLAFQSILASASYSDISDINGDGKQEISCYYNGTMYYYSINRISSTQYSISSTTSTNIIGSNKQYGDFNGDGMMDYLLNPSTGSYKIAYGKGGSYEISTNYLTVPSNFCYVGDYNGDGFSDMLFNKVYVFNPNTGTFTNSFVIHFYNGYNSYITKSYFCDEYNPIAVLPGDYNGDSKTELLFIGATSGSVILFDQNKIDNYVSRILDGVNNYVDIKYLPITGSVYQQDLNHPFSAYPLFVVSETRTPNPHLEGSNYLADAYFTNNYNYKNAVYLKKKRCFGGFKALEIQDYLTHHIATHCFSNDWWSYNYTGMLPTLSNIKTQPNENNISINLSTTSNEEYVFTDKGNNSFLITPHIQKSLNYVDNIEIDITSTYNSDGNPTSINTKTGIFNPSNYAFTQEDETTVNYSNYTAAGLTIPHKPCTVETIKHATGEDVLTEISTFTYSTTNGALTSSTSMGVTATYSNFNSFGQSRQVVVSSTGLNSRTSLCTYDSKGRYITSSTNPMSKVTEFEYDPVYCLKLKDIDINGRETNYDYDNFGNKIKTKTPDGIESLEEVKWYTDTQIPGARYYSISSITGSSPVKNYFDCLGRKLKTESKDLNDATVYTSVNYNNLGQVKEQTVPYYSGTTNPDKTIYAYYENGDNRVNSIVSTTSNITYTYQPRITTVTNSSTGQVSKKEYNSLGQLVNSTNNNLTAEVVSYDYYSSGLFESATSLGLTTTVRYDVNGRQSKLIDPDAGEINYIYNNFGELISQTDNMGNNYEMTYDDLGRLIEKVGIEGDYTYTYDNGTVNWGVLNSLTAPNNNSISYTYDNLGRVLETTNSISGQSFKTSISYNSDGKPSQMVYPSGFKINYEYKTTNGRLYSVKNGLNNQTIWTLADENEFGQPEQIQLGNNLIAYLGYDANKLPDYIKTGTSLTTGLVQNIDYGFDAYWARPTSRNNAFGASELFGYDDVKKMNQLASVTVLGRIPPKVYDYTYASNGNIESKSEIGTYSYLGTQPHAVTNIDNPLSNIPLIPQALTYTSFNKVATVSEDDNELFITYGPDFQRSKTEYYENSQLELTKYFVGNYEKEITAEGTRELHYISGPTGNTAVYIITNGTGAMYYTHTDQLGSIMEITDQSGQLVQRMSYDAWGKRTLNYTTSQYTTFMLDRGYTMHEHLESFKLINMNGRMYDPLLGRFLSPDNYVQTPGNALGFNRYSYCMNNPMVYTDPSGEFLNLVIGAAIGGTFNVLMNLNNIHSFGQGLAYFGVGAIAGAVGAGIGGGVGSYLAGGSFGAGFLGSSTALTATSSFVTGAQIGVASGFAGGFVGGTGNAWLGGSNFGSGIKAGFESGSYGALIGGVLGGIIGGFDAVGDEKNFWSGDDVEIGRNSFSLNNTPVSLDELYYLDSDGHTIRVSQFNDPNNRTINTRFWNNEGTCDRFTHDIDLEIGSDPTTTARVDIAKSLRIKGFAGIENGRYYWEPADGVSFTSNNGLNRIVTSGPGRFSFPSNGLRTITARIFGTGINDGTSYAPNSFRVIVRLKL